MKSFVCFVVFLLLMCSAGVATADEGEEGWINQALKTNSNVTIPEGIHVIKDSIVLNNGNTLICEPGAVITIPDHAGWQAWKPLISASGVQDITVRNCVIDANYKNNKDVNHGKGFYNIMHFTGCNNILVDGNELRNSQGDGLRTKYCSNVVFSNNLVYRMGHEGAYFIDSDGVLAYNNDITTRTDGGLRLWNCKNLRFDKNKIKAELALRSLSGNAGIQIEDSKGVVKNIEICNNIIYSTWGAGIWNIGYGESGSNSQDIYIHHNLFSAAGQSYNIKYTGGIVNDGLKGFRVTNNVFDSCFNNAFRNQVEGQNSIIKDNIITNTQTHAGISQSGTGSGIADLVGNRLTITNNNFYTNVADNCFGCSSSNDDTNDPKTHFTSSGWTWDNNVNTWTCLYVPPTPLNISLPTVSSDVVDTDTHDIWDILDTELTVTGDIEQKSIRVVNPKWQQEKTTSGYIYLGGFPGEIHFSEKENYIPKNASEIAKVYTSTSSTQERVVSQESNTQLIDGPNNTLIVKLNVKTTYKVPEKKKLTIAGKSKLFGKPINVTSYKTKTEKVTFTKTFPAPPVFPTIKAPKVTVLHYVGNHAIIKIPNDPGIARVDVKLRNNIARQYRYIGEIGTAENGFRSTKYNSVDTWKFKGWQFARSDSGLYVKEPFNVSDLEIYVTTPYKTMEVEEYEYERIEDTSSKFLTVPYITFVIVVIIFGGAIFAMFQGRFECLKLK